MPYYTCRGWAGGESWITVPITTWEISPDYPLVGVPFYIGLGSVPALRQGTGSAYSFNSGNITFPGLVDIRGLITEIRLVPIKQSAFPDWTYNGVLDYDYSTISYGYGGLITYLGDELDPEKKVIDSPETKSASDYGIPYYTNLSGWGVDTMQLRAYASMSSYHAGSPSSYRGEPAYRMEITTHWQVQAQASVDNYRVWERQFSHNRTECRPGPNNAGEFDCQAPVGNWYQPGHTVTIPVYIYTWSAWKGSSEGSWVTVDDEIHTSAVLWPGGILNDHFPILVYQSQPILQEP